MNGQWMKEQLDQMGDPSQKVSLEFAEWVARRGLEPLIVANSLGNLRAAFPEHTQEELEEVAKRELERRRP
jgi:hypothetical protein